MQSKTEKITFYGIILFLFCYFIQIFDMPNSVTVPIGALLCFTLVIKQKKIRLDLETCFLMITLGFYFVNDFGFTKAITSPYCYVAPVVYILAHYLACEIKCKENHERLFCLLVLTMVIGITFHGLLNSYAFFENQFIDKYHTPRVWDDFWTREYIYGTMQIAYFFPAFTLIFPTIICWKGKKCETIFWILSSVVFVTVGFLSQTRTPVLILPIIIMLQFGLYVFLEKEIVKKFFSGKRVFIFSGMMIIAVIGGMILLINTSVGRSFIVSLGRDGGIFNNIRFKIHRSALEQLFMYPMGGNMMDHLGYGHTHNAWLDIADIGGVIPFFSFIGYTILTVYEVVRFIMKKKVSSYTKLIIMGLYIIYFIFFTIEPSLDWSVHFMVPWLFVHGAIHGYTKNDNRGRECYFQ